MLCDPFYQPHPLRPHLPSFVRCFAVLSGIFGESRYSSPFLLSLPLKWGNTALIFTLKLRTLLDKILLMNLEIIGKLSQIVAERKRNPAEGSYTSSLFAAGDNKIVKKLGEESAEFIRAFFKCDNDELAGEAADYIYHLMVALEYRGTNFGRVLDILAERHK